MQKKKNELVSVGKKCKLIRIGWTQGLRMLLILTSDAFNLKQTLMKLSQEFSTKNETPFWEKIGYKGNVLYLMEWIGL